MISTPSIYTKRLPATSLQCVCRCVDLYDKRLEKKNNSSFQGISRHLFNLIAVKRYILKSKTFARIYLSNFLALGIRICRVIARKIRIFVLKQCNFSFLLVAQKGNRSATHSKPRGLAVERSQRQLRVRRAATASPSPSNCLSSQWNESQSIRATRETRL